MVVNKERIWLLLWLGIAILATVLLAAGLSQLELDPGLLEDRAVREELRGLLLGQASAFRNIALLVLILAPLVILLTTRRRVRVQTPVAEKPKRRSLLVTLLQILMWTIALLIIRRQIAEGELVLNPPEISQMPQVPQMDSVEALSVNIPDWLAFVFSLLFIVVVFLIAWGIWRLRQRPSRARQLVVREAQTALGELQAGGDLGNVILRCYYEMNQVVDRRRGIRRKEGMTPREFEGHLISLGFPREPVEGLTRLFELVRYGARDPDQRAERQAMDCLEAIVQASGERA
jgi:hypothetical protein